MTEQGTALDVALWRMDHVIDALSSTIPPVECPGLAHAYNQHEGPMKVTGSTSSRDLEAQKFDWLPDLYRINFLKKWEAYLRDGTLTRQVETHVGSRPETLRLSQGEINRIVLQGKHQRSNWPILFWWHSCNLLWFLNFFSAAGQPPTVKLCAAYDYDSKFCPHVPDSIWLNQLIKCSRTKQMSETLNIGREKWANASFQIKSWGLMVLSIRNATVVDTLIWEFLFHCLWNMK